MTRFVTLSSQLKALFDVDVPIYSGTGRTLDDPYLISSDGSPESRDYSSIEYFVIDCLCEIQNYEWELVRQSLFNQNGRKIDSMQIEVIFLDEESKTYKKKTETYYFDITECLSHPGKENGADKSGLQENRNKPNLYLEQNIPEATFSNTSLDTYDIYYYPLRAERAYLRNSPVYRLRMFLNKNPRMAHIATCIASSKEEAIKKALDSNIETSPEPLGTLSQYFFGLREKRTAASFAELMSLRRELFDQYIQKDLLGKSHDLQPGHKREITIFTYLIEWMGLILSEMPRKEIQLAMMCFSHLTSSDSANIDDESMRSITVTDLQSAIQEINTTHKPADNLSEIVGALMARVSFHLNLNDSQIDTLWSEAVKQLQINIDSNDKYTNKYRVTL